MDPICLTNKQARQFILIKQGMIGDYKFHGKDGVLEFVKQAGCVQFDPIDVCGKNAELVLQSRVEGFTKQMLNELLYEDRLLVDYFDKNLAIIAVGDWKYFERIREEHRLNGRGYEKVNEVAEQIKTIIAEKGPVCSKDIGLTEKVDWYWSDTNLSRAALETLYFRGDLIVHHKKGSKKYYALTKDTLPQEIITAQDPFEDELEHMMWRTLRRISAVGLIWNKSSDAWLTIRNMKSKERNMVFEGLLVENKILELTIEGFKEPFYCLIGDKWIIDQVLSEPDLRGRTELIAPLDSMLWDRKLIKKIFDFEYTWEIYIPLTKRKYGYYTLPVISGEQFIGRVEVIVDKKRNALVVKNIWYEKDVQIETGISDDLKECFHRFMVFHGLKEIVYANG